MSFLRTSSLALALTSVLCVSAFASPLAVQHVYIGVSDPPLNSRIEVFPATARGDVPPTYVIEGKNTRLFQPDGTAWKDGNLYVADAGYFGFDRVYQVAPHVMAFARTARGNATPIRDIHGKNTTLMIPAAVTLDSQHRLYVEDLNNCAVDVFGATANGNVAPISVLMPASGCGGLALDSSDDIFVGDAYSGTINEYAPGSSGNVKPVASFSTGGAAVYNVTISGQVLAADVQAPDDSTTAQLFSLPGFEPMLTLQLAGIDFWGIGFDSSGDVFAQTSERALKKHMRVMVFLPGQSHPSREFGGHLSDMHKVAPLAVGP